MNITCIIPARMESSRFPGKPLKKILGRELVLRCCDTAKQSSIIDNIIVATENDEIEQVVTAEGYNVIRTPSFPSCTHRVGYVAQQIDCDYIINLQGDEPCVTAKMLDDMIKFTVDNKHQMTQAVYDLDYTDISDQNIVKAVINNNSVIGLSRIPEVISSNLKGIAGVYVYDHSTIANFHTLDMRLVEAWKGLDTFGFIGAVPVVPFEFPHRTHAVDVPSDISTVESKLL